MGVAPTISRLGAPNRARYSFAGIIYNASKNASDYSPGNKALKNTLTPEAQLKTSVKFATLPQPPDKDCPTPQQASLH